MLSIFFLAVGMAAVALWLWVEYTTKHIPTQQQDKTTASDTSTIQTMMKQCGIPAEQIEPFTCLALKMQAALQADMDERYALKTDVALVNGQTANADQEHRRTGAASFLWMALVCLLMLAGVAAYRGGWPTLFESLIIGVAAALSLLGAFASRYR